MSDIKAKLKTFIDPFLKHPACLTNTILLALTTGFEQAWENINFKCPENPSIGRNELYSVVFVGAPALALWILGILGSNVAGRLCQGLKYRGDKHECGCFNFFAIVLRAAVVPLAWVFVALMDGDFYACFKYLPSCSEGLVDGDSCTKNSTAWTYENKVESQLYAWLFLVLSLFIGSCVVFCGKRCSKRTYFPHLYSEKLKKGERKLIEERLMEQAEKDGKKNVGALMIKFIKKETVSASEWESICREYTLQECEDAKKDAAGTQNAGTQDKEVLYHSPLSEYLKDHEDLLDEFKKEEAKADTQSK